MPQYPYQPIFVPRGRYPNAQYPQQGQIPIFTPPIVAPGGVSVGTPTAGGSNVPYYEQMPSTGPQMPAGGGTVQSPMTMPDGSPVQPQDNVRQMTPEEQARFAPDQAPPGKGLQPEPKSGWRKFFDNLTSAPNATALLTAGSILSSAPHPGESPLGQAVRGINGAYSTYGLFAQQRAAQAEAQRKAGLEREKQNNENLTTVTNARKANASVGQADRGLDIKQTQVENDAAANDQKQKALDQYRKERLAQQSRELDQANRRLSQADAELAQKKEAHADDINMQGRRNQINEQRNQALNDIAWAQIGISRTRTEKDLDTLKVLELAGKLSKETAPIDAIGWSQAQKEAFFNQKLEQIKAEKATAKGGQAAGPKPVLTDKEMQGVQ